MRFLRRSLLGLFLFAATLAILAWAVIVVKDAVVARMTRENNVRPAEERIFAAHVVKIAPLSISPVLTTFGEVRSTRTLDIRTTAAGRIIGLSSNFVEGGTVQSGEVLVTIDPSDAQAALDVALTDLAEAEANVREAERALEIAREEAIAAEAQAALQARALDRARDLAERGVGSATAVETAELANAQADQSVLARAKALAAAEAALDQTKTMVERRQIALDEAKRRLSDTQIAATFDGILAEVSGVEGGLASGNERLARLIDPKALEVSFRLSTSQYARLLDEDGRLKQATVEAVLEVLGADLTVPGTITRESGAVAEGQTGRLLFAALQGATGFRPGDFVTVRITEPELTNVALLPASALDGTGTVLVLGLEERLERLPVTVLRRQGDDVIIAVARDLDGREVITERSPFLGVGIRIRPLRSDTESATAEPDFLELAPERRAALIAFVEGNTRMPDEVKARVLAQLNEVRVPADVVHRIEARMGG